jgi:multiple sugar transport system permease protein
MYQHSIKSQERLSGYLFILPWFLGFLFFYLGPMLFSFVISFCNWDYFKNLTFIGLDNYFNIFDSTSHALPAMGRTFKFVFIEVPLQLVISLTVAMLLTRKIPGTRISRTLVYLPAVMSGAVGGLIWRYMFNTQTGLFNYLLSFVGVGPIPWIDNPDIALYSIILTGVWAIGQPMILFIAAIQSVPKTYYEVAEVDGAGKLLTFRHITLPMITPTILINTIIILIHQFQILAPIIVITSGGPAKSTYLYSYLEYENAFKFLKMGYASALSWVMFAIILIITLIIMKSSRKWVFYQSEKGKML